MRLFIRLYLDEDVSVLVAKLLRARGYDVLTTREAGNLHASDGEQLQFAVSQERVLMTHNREDFERLYQEYLDVGKKLYGIIIAFRRNTYELSRRLMRLLNTVTANEMESTLRYI